MRWGRRLLAAIALLAGAVAPAGAAPGLDDVYPITTGLLPYAAAFADAPAYMLGEARFTGYTLYLGAHTVVGGDGKAVGVRVVAARVPHFSDVAEATADVYRPIEETAFVYGFEHGYYTLRLWVTLPKIGFVEAMMLSQTRGGPARWSGGGSRWRYTVEAQNGHRGAAHGSVFNAGPAIAQSTSFSWGARGTGHFYATWPAIPG